MGEGMLELSEDGDGRFRMHYGGDTLNTAIYLARLGVRTHYVSALGSDPYSDGLARDWAAEGLDLGHLLRDPARLPGLYAIRTDESGEREFFYWRRDSAARAFFALPGADDALELMAGADWLYLTGITLSLFDAAQCARLAEAAARVRRSGGQVVFDPNYRPRGWPEPGAARRAFEALAPNITLLMSSLEDEQQLYGDHAPDFHAQRWREFGVPDVIITCGGHGALVYEQGRARRTISVRESITPTDTTGAGDSFNAGFIAARIAGRSMTDAVQAGHRLAGMIIQHRGAIIPESAMPDLDLS